MRAFFLICLVAFVVCQGQGQGNSNQGDATVSGHHNEVITNTNTNGGGFITAGEVVSFTSGASSTIATSTFGNRVYANSGINEGYGCAGPYSIFNMVGRADTDFGCNCGGSSFSNYVSSIGTYITWESVEHNSPTFGSYTTEGTTENGYAYDDSSYTSLAYRFYDGYSSSEYGALYTEKTQWCLNGFYWEKSTTSRNQALNGEWISVGDRDAALERGQAYCKDSCNNIGKRDISTASNVTSRKQMAREHFRKFRNEQKSQDGVKSRRSQF